MTCRTSRKSILALQQVTDLADTTICLYAERPRKPLIVEGLDVET